MNSAVQGVRHWSFERAATRGLPPGATPRPSLELELARIARGRGSGRYREFFAPDARRLFFINAHPRSGTNWLGALMNLHPQITCTGEFTFHELFNAVQAMATLPGRAAGREPARTTLLQHYTYAVRACMTAVPTRFCLADRDLGGTGLLTSASGAARSTKQAIFGFAEDTGRETGATKDIPQTEPSVNSGYHDPAPGKACFGDHTPRRLRILLPDASYIVLFRDGRDVLVSWTYNALARKEHWVVPASIRTLFDQQLDRFTAATLTNDTPGQHAAAGAMLTNEVWVRHVARQWASHVRDDVDGIARIKSGELPGQVLTLRYEDLHADTEGVRAEAYRFLGAEPRQAAPLEQGSNTLPGFVGRAGTGHGGTPTRAEDPRSHYRRGQVGDWREKLSPQAVGWIAAEAGTELAFLGY